MVFRCRSIYGLLAVVLWIAVTREDRAQPPATAPSGKTTADKLEFEVASVRQNQSDDKPQSSFSLDSSNLYSTVNRDDVFVPEGGYFSATNQPLWRYIVFAYKLTGTQELALRFNYFAGLASSVPGWVNTERFDIKARVEGKPTKDQVRYMMQALLAERFQLVVHHETRQVPVFALVLVKQGTTGPNLQRHLADDSCAGEPGTRFVPDTARLPDVCGVIAHLRPSAPGRTSFGARDVTLALLASSLPTQTGMSTLPRPVIDETGLSGTFDFKLEWALESDSGTEVSGPTFQKALKEQLGLKLESEKGPVDLIVLDHLEHLPRINTLARFRSADDAFVILLVEGDDAGGAEVVPGSFTGGAG